jgi:hypothetical protein
VLSDTDGFAALVRDDSKLRKTKGSELPLVAAPVTVSKL